MREKQTLFQSGNATKATLLIGCAVLIIAALAYIYFFGNKPSTKQAAPAILDQQKAEQQQKDFSDVVAKKGYPAGMPADLILNPMAQATTTIVTNKKTGVTTISIVYTENRQINEVMVMYPIALKAGGYTIAPQDSKQPGEIDATKGDITASFTFVPLSPFSTKVTMVLKSSN